MLKSFRKGVKMFKVIYKNDGRRKRTGNINTRKEAEERADFLRFQGAKQVKVIYLYHEPCDITDYNKRIDEVYY